MLVQVKRANVTREEGQKAVDRFTYLITLGLKKYAENGGDLTVLEKRNEMTFLEWYDYINELKNTTEK